MAQQTLLQSTEDNPKRDKAFYFTKKAEGYIPYVDALTLKDQRVEAKFSISLNIYRNYLKKRNQSKYQKKVDGSSSLIVEIIDEEVKDIYNDSWDNTFDSYPIQISVALFDTKFHFEGYQQHNNWKKCLDEGIHYGIPKKPMTKETLDSLTDPEAILIANKIIDKRLEFHTKQAKQIGGDAGTKNLLKWKARCIALKAYILTLSNKTEFTPVGDVLGLGEKVNALDVEEIQNAFENSQDMQSIIEQYVPGFSEAISAISILESIATTAGEIYDGAKEAFAIAKAVPLPTLPPGTPPLKDLIEATFTALKNAFQSVKKVLDNAKTAILKSVTIPIPVQINDKGQKTINGKVIS